MQAVPQTRLAGLLTGGYFRETPCLRFDPRGIRAHPSSWRSHATSI